MSSSGSRPRDQERPQQKGRSSALAEASLSIFRQFCMSSTLHGTYFWAEARTVLGKALWVVVVGIGIAMSAFVINKSFSAWKSNPVVTSVAQIPIEQVPFPSFTVCPTGNTRFNYAEQIVSERGLGSRRLARAALARLALALVEDLGPLDEGHCMAAVACNNSSSSSCQEEDVNPYRRFEEEGEEGPLNMLRQIFPGVDITSPRRPLKTDCLSRARQFLFLRDFRAAFASAIIDDDDSDDGDDGDDDSNIPAGAVLRMLYANLRREDLEDFYRTFLPEERFPELYGSELGIDQGGAGVPLPELVEELTRDEEEEEEEEDGAQSRRGEKKSWDFEDALEKLSMSTELLRLMRTSLHPPHKVIRAGAAGRRKPEMTPNAAFPYCYYQDKDEEGVRHGPYGARYCDSFQTTFNEMGLCYTYNAGDLGIDPDLDEDAVKVRNVKGCGWKKGLSLIIDRQKLWTKPLLRRSPDRHFVVYVTVPGVVTHKVPFTVDSSYHGEHHFFVHGIHFITASDAFIQWNDKNNFCYGPQTKNLTNFAFYTQDNCLLECRYNKIMDRCGCSPWYLKQTRHRVCGRAGNQCFKDAFDSYQEDLQDLVECDCRSDCGGLHIFSSMSRYSFDDETATQPELWWDRRRGGGGRLAEYLLDREDFLADALSKNLTRLALNLTDYLELADRRFHEDITVVNVFFDTPIITQVKLEMKITIFDQISAIGGTLGLFTGISLISFVEVTYWLLRLLSAGAFTTLFGGEDGLLQVTKRRIGQQQDDKSNLGSGFGGLHPSYRSVKKRRWSLFNSIAETGEKQGDTAWE